MSNSQCNPSNDENTSDTPDAVQAETAADSCKQTDQTADDPSVAAKLTVENPVMREDELRRDYPYLYYGAHASDEKTIFRVYAPEATEVILLREGNGWGEKYEPMSRHEDGVWQIEIEGNLRWTHYKYRIKNNHGYMQNPYDCSRIDPFSAQLAVQFGSGGSRTFNSVVPDRTFFEWTHKHPQLPSAPMSIYEMHMGTFWQGNYRDIAEKLVGHMDYLGFTHIQVMPPFQTPIYESWGYLVGCPYAVSERYGTVDDFKWMVNRLHEAGLGVIVDVPCGFGIQDWDCGLSNFDGTELYHHVGPRGWNQQWQTRMYNLTQPYVRDYLTGIFTYLYHELGIDGVRVDAVSSQLFYDYDRGTWDWPRNDREKVSGEDWDIFNGLGGDRFFENRGYWLSEAVDFSGLRFFRDLHKRLEHTSPKLFTIAEESRRVFPRLACPVDEGGLGFTYAQNMGEMHRVRKYLSLPVESRRIEEIEKIMLTKAPETFVNAMNTHDECANGKTRLITELNSHVQLIGLAAFCWFKPGAPMIFMGDELGEEGWFDVWRGLDWNKAGPGAAMHEQQLTNNFHDLNYLLRHEPALAFQDSWSMDKLSSNNERKYFSFVRWGCREAPGSGNWDHHKDDLIFVRNEAPHSPPCQAEVYMPTPGEYQVIYNSIDERYIGQQDYNRHDPYWSCHCGDNFLYLDLQPYQNLVLKRKS